jgi:signal transduction histidine kinase
MGRLEKRPRLAVLAMLALVALVLVLAVLQYEWVNQLGRAAEERMRETLAASTGQFRQDFARELLRVCSAFQPDPATAPAALEDGLVARYGNWLSGTAHRGLVVGLYLWRADGEATGLRAMDGKTFRFADMAWPARFANLHEQLILEGWNLSGVSERAAYRQPWMLHASSLTLVEPLFHVSPGGGAPAQDARHLGFLIVELDRQYVQQQYLPGLVERYFGQQGSATYVVAVRTRAEPKEVLFRSSPAQLPPAATPDAAADLLDPSSDTLSEHPGLSLLPASPDHQWQISVQHRTGSLRAAAASLRWRNLAISFSLLFLLAASVALILVLARRTERLARLQMEFVAGVSHELRTPLAVICSAADNLADGVVNSPDHAREYGGLIRSEGRRLARMVEQVLRFTASKAGALIYDIEPVEAGPVIERAIAAVQPLLASSGIQVEKSVASGLPLVLADEASLEQCLENLLSNAIKYAASGRWLAARAFQATDGTGNEVLLEIEDRGPGIPAAEIGRVFEPFYRAQAAREVQIRGVGLGLPLVRSMAEGMGGRVTVTSQPGRGCKFTLHLPVFTGET